jgi:hypothetical protein
MSFCNLGNYHHSTLSCTDFGRVVATRVDTVNFVWTAGVAPVTSCMADFFRYPFCHVVCLCCESLICVAAVTDMLVSVRWSGSVFPNYAGTGQVRARFVSSNFYEFMRRVSQVYTFRTTTTSNGDEGVRLWIDGQLLIDAWATSRYFYMPRKHYVFETPLKRRQCLCVFKHSSVSRRKCAVSMSCWFIKSCRFVDHLLGFLDTMSNWTSRITQALPP